MSKQINGAVLEPKHLAGLSSYLLEAADAYLETNGLTLQQRGELRKAIGYETLKKLNSMAVRNVKNE